MTDRPGTGCALAVMLGALLWVSGFAVTHAAPATPEPTGEVGTALIAGKASHVGTQFGPDYLALPEHKWGQRGLLVTICGDGGCVTRRSTDAGPDLAMQRAGRVADLNAWDFERVCGCDASVGLTDVTVEYLGEIELPATDTEGVQ